MLNFHLKKVIHNLALWFVSYRWIQTFYFDCCERKWNWMEAKKKELWSLYDVLFGKRFVKKINFTVGVYVVRRLSQNGRKLKANKILSKFAHSCDKSGNWFKLKNGTNDECFEWTKKFFVTRLALVWVGSCFVNFHTRLKIWRVC